MLRFLAFDLGAESGRAMRGHLSDGRLALTALHRFANTPRRVEGTLRWDVDLLWHHLRHALTLPGPPLASIGVDAWGCDYALLDAAGTPVEAPYHYRDPRTDGVMDEVITRVGRARIYETTGVQFLPFNTLFQLSAAMASDPAPLERATTLVTMADLFNRKLTGRTTCEYTSATTTQCVDARRRAWARALLDDLGLPSHLFGPLVEPGTELGPVHASVGAQAGVPVVAPACHDTGSAVAAVATGGDTAFLSSGTWSLLGVELQAPVITMAAQAANFTNEGGVCGTTRLLKNIAGLWLLQACRRTWALAGAEPSYGELATRAEAAPAGVSIFDPDDPTLLHPTDMPEAIAFLCRRTAQPVPDTPAACTRAIVDSLALKYRMVLDELESVTGLSIRAVRVIGGGARNVLLNQTTADVTGRLVLAGPVEATALGNIAMQMLATGAVATLDEARAIVADSFPVQVYRPRVDPRWDGRYALFRDIAGAMS